VEQGADQFLAFVFGLLGVAFGREGLAAAEAVLVVGEDYLVAGFFQQLAGFVEQWHLFLIACCGTHGARDAGGEVNHARALVLSTMVGQMRSRCFGLRCGVGPLRNATFAGSLVSAAESLAQQAGAHDQHARHWRHAA
jgi:hypothetical protein